LKTLLIFLIAIGASRHAFTQSDPYAESGMFIGETPNYAPAIPQSKIDADNRERAAFEKAGAVTLRGKILSVVSEGAAILVRCAGAGSAWSNPLWCNPGKTPVPIPITAAPHPLLDCTALLLVPSGFPPFADDDPVNFIAAPTGQIYHYTAADGAAKTVRVYTLDTAIP
jgi:hypothetical protein